MDQKIPTPRIVAIIQARLDSTRLPGKVLMDIAGKPMLAHVVERTRRAKWLDEVVVATTTEEEDQPIVSFCENAQIPFFRGSEYDVLDRYYQAAQYFKAEVVVRITADCPLIDPVVIDDVIEKFFFWGSSNSESCREDNGMDLSLAEEKSGKLKPRWDFAANRLPPPWKRTFPIGLDTEICTFAALAQAWRAAQQPFYREHVMPYIYDPDHSVHYSTLDKSQTAVEVPSGFFKVLVVDHDPDYGHYRWTVDTEEDLLLLREIFAHFDNQNRMSWQDVLNLFQDHPELGQINATVHPKTVSEIDQRGLKP